VNLAKGVMVAMINMVVVAFAIAYFNDPHEVREVVFLICRYAAIPAAFCGLIAGAIASVNADRGVLVRLAWLAPLPIALVVLLGKEFYLQRFVLPSCVPTLAAVAVLERWTRRRVAPPLPTARTV
jgi:hypothetical protein